MARARGVALTLPANDAGTGPGLAVVFLHALAGAPAHWSEQLAHLRRERRAVALTLRGHPGAPVRKGFDIPALAADVVQTLDALGLGTCALVGHGIGAQVALAVAAARPQQIAGVLLADAAGEAAPGGLPAGLDARDCISAIERHYRALLVGGRSRVAERVLTDLHATPPATLIGVLRAAGGFDPAAALDAYPGPRIAIDTWLAGRVASLAQRRPGLRSTRMGDSGHWMQLDRPHEFNLLLDGFIGSLHPVRRAPKPVALG